MKKNCRYIMIYYAGVPWKLFQEFLHYKQVQKGSFRLTMKIVELPRKTIAALKFLPPSLLWLHSYTFLHVTTSHRHRWKNRILRKRKRNIIPFPTPTSRYAHEFYSWVLGPYSLSPWTTRTRVCQSLRHIKLVGFLLHFFFFNVAIQNLVNVLLPISGFAFPTNHESVLI